MRTQRTRQGRIGHAFIASRPVWTFIRVLMPGVGIRQVGKGVHGGTLLAEADQQSERQN